MRTLEYNNSIGQNILRNACQEINDQDEHDFKQNETLTSSIHQILTSKHLSQDEFCVLQIIQEYYVNIKSGYENGITYTAPILLMTGLP